MKRINRRKFHRINFDGKVNLQFTDRSYEFCQIKNLSLTGMYVSGDFQQKPPENCHVQLFHKETTENNSLLASARVVWSSDEGVGLKFTAMTFENYMLLLTTLINKAEQPVIILSEFPRSSPFEITN